MNKLCFFTQEKCFDNIKYFDLDGRSYISPICGRYRFAYDNAESSFDSAKTTAFLCYHSLHKTKDYFLLTANEYVALYESSKDKEARILTPQIIDNWYPKSFAERIDLILNYLSQFSSYLGAKIPLLAKRCSAQLLMINKYDLQDERMKG